MSAPDGDAFSPETGVLPIPSDNFLCIEYPGVIKNVDKAIETLGGMAQIQETFAGNQRWLSLNFRPSNLYSVPIEGERTPTTKMILSLTLSEDGSASGKFIGTVPTSYRFTGLAPYAYVPRVPSLQDPLLEPNKQTMEIPADDARDLSNDRLIHIPPVAVTSIDLPLAYNYQPNGLYALEDVPAHDSAGNVVGTEQRLVKKSRLPKGRGDASYFVYHTAENIPTEPIGTTVPPQFVGVVQKLKALFAARPVWTRQMIHFEVPELDRVGIRTVLPYVAYYFWSGALRKCWVRLGHDPRKSPEDRIYQIIELRVQPSETRGQSDSYWNKRLSHKPGRKKRAQPSSVQAVLEAEADPTEGQEVAVSREVCLFSAPPGNRTTAYQCCDISIPIVKRLVEETEPRAVYDPYLGWFPAALVTRLRNILKQRLVTLLRAFDEGTLGTEHGPNLEDESDLPEDLLMPITTANQPVDVGEDKDAMDVDDPPRSKQPQPEITVQPDEEDDEDEEDEADLTQLDARGVSRMMFGREGDTTAPTLNPEQLNLLQSMVGGATPGKQGSLDDNDEMAPYNILGLDEDDDEGW